MTVTKMLYDETGETVITTDSTPFSYRLYLGTEFEDELSLANMHPYYVKGPDGCYCLWDYDQQCFISLNKTNFDDLTEQEKADAVFHASINGQISKIPSCYTVEVRDLLPGTQFLLVERASDIPDGYSFQKYEYNGTVFENEEAGVSGTVSAEGDHEITVRNLKGWGLRINKIWTDADYMESRDATYFAVFTLDEGGNPVYVNNTLRMMPYGSPRTQTLYWYFDRLESGKTISQHVIREVTVTLDGPEPIIDENGIVTNGTHIVPVADLETITLSGRQKGETVDSEFLYTVYYTQGQIPEDSNVRVDTATNDRPGIVLKKSKADFDDPLAGAVFTLTDEAGDLIGTFTSAEDGLITVAYLRDGVNYTLTETSAPQGWYGLPSSLIIRRENSDVQVSGADPFCYRLDNDGGTLTVRNCPYTFEAVKLDGSHSDAPMRDVHFELHRWVSVGGQEGYDINPMVGYEDLVSRETGVIPLLDNTLEPGRYELQEKEPPSGYQPLPAYIHFMVSATGEITLENAPYGVSLNVNTSEDGTLVYTLTVKNYEPASVVLRKTDDRDPEHEITGAVFALCCRDQNSWVKVNVNGSDDNVVDMTSLSLFTINDLDAGWYRLEETHAPDGYVTLTKFIYFILDADGTVRLTDEAGSLIPADESGQTVYGDITLTGKTISVKNHTGAALPNTGGAGTHVFGAIGAALTIGAVSMLMLRRKRYC